MNITEEVEQVKRELSEMIIALLKENKIEIAKAQQLAADFLAILPVKDYPDLFAKLKTLGDNYTDVRNIYLRELTAYNETRREEALLQMRAAIAQGNMEHAITVAKAIRGGTLL